MLSKYYNEKWWLVYLWIWQIVQREVMVGLLVEQNEVSVVMRDWSAFGGNAVACLLTSAYWDKETELSQIVRRQRAQALELWLVGSCVGYCQAGEASGLGVLIPVERNSSNFLRLRTRMPAAYWDLSDISPCQNLAHFMEGSAYVPRQMDGRCKNSWPLQHSPNGRLRHQAINLVL